ncbi:MAG: hypothetical protein K8T90_16550 [Planctomycetes bacterium]|nr:hypothetical protein [Planctomycetota bacterium]
MRASIVMGAWLLVGAALATGFVISRRSDPDGASADADRASPGERVGTRAHDGAAAPGPSVRAAGPTRRAAVRASPPELRNGPPATHDDSVAVPPDGRASTGVQPPSTTGGVADGGVGATGKRPTAHRTVTPPRPSVPEHAVVIVASDDVRAWLVVDRPPRGLVSEPGSASGRLQLCLSKAAPAPLIFRIESDPPGALRLVARGDPVLKVAAGRDGGSFAVAGLVRGTAHVVARLVEGGDAATAQPLTVPLDVTSQDDFSSPILEARAEPPPEGEASSALVGGSQELLGLRGGVAGRIVLRRSGFRGFQTEPTSVQVVADDPVGILDDVPWLVTIPAGQSAAPSPLVVRLRDVEGEAKLRFRSGDQEAANVVRSASARWTGPARIVLPLGARAVVPLSLAPGAREMPGLHVAAADTGLAGVSVVAPSKAPAAERVDLTLDGRAVGETTVRVSAPSRPEFVAALVVVPREIEVRDGHLVLTGLSTGARGDVRLAVVNAAARAGVDGAGSGSAGPAKPGRLVLDDGVGVPAGVAVERGGGASIILHLTIEAGGPGELMVPVRIEGTFEGLRVADASRGESRAEYTIRARP